MMQRILLVAAREFRQIAATRSFWVTLLILPAALAMGPVAARLMDDSKTQQVMLIDPAGRAAGAIRERIELDEQRRLLTALSRYAQRHELQGADPRALWAQHDRIYSDADLAAFVARGGAPQALRAMKEAIDPDTPAFTPPEPLFEIVPTPPALAEASGAEVDRLLQPRLHPEDAAESKPLNYAVYVPREFGAAGAAVRLWSRERPAQAFVQPLQSVLTRQMRERYLEASGLSAEQARIASTLTPEIAVTSPPPGGGRERVLVRSILPLASAYILLMSLLLSGSWMLQGVVEERSNKLIETVLACVSPNELMYGKLLGTVAIGLAMVLVWVLCGVGAAFATQGAIADMLRPALAPLASPQAALAMIYFFVAGYVMISMVFLAIGAMSDSFRDAQGYLTPVILVIAMPFAILAQAILEDKGGIALTLMTWIPIYTPFTMLARLGTGVPLWEILATATMLGAFIVAEFVLLGRVFRATLLNSGQKPSLAAIGRMMRREED